MRIGIGLPIDADPAGVRAWAEQVEDGPFDVLAVLDRLVYDNVECLTTLAAVAGCTRRVTLQSEVVLAPLRSAALLAKQCATIDAISGRRLVVGAGVGSRRDDYLAAGAEFGRRGRTMDRHLATLRRIWAGENVGDGVGPVGPAPARAGGPPILLGGYTPPVIRRVAEHADGFLSAASPEKAAELFDAVDTAWSERGRSGRPRKVAQVNVALGGNRADEARESIRSYYGRRVIAGVVPSDQIVKGLIDSEDGLAGALRSYRELGVDDVVCYLWTPDLGQLDRIADAWRAVDEPASSPASR